ncbi:MAG: ABC transporter ATP-binding protein [Halobacteriaceae archaeon]
MSEQTDKPTERTEEPVVSLDDVSVEFDTGQSVIDRLTGEKRAVRAVQDVSLDIGENEVVALVGESGCGKTTLGKTAIGLQEPTSGAVRYRGQDVQAAKAGRGDIPFGRIRPKLQIIHQDPGASLEPQRTVQAILSDPLKRWYDGLAADERREYLIQFLQAVGVTPAENYLTRYPHQLSGGEQQRVALARALLMQPELVLADEAISALDVSLRVDMMDLMLELQERFDTSYLFISHDISNARYLTEKADGRIGIMYLGELVEIGPVEEIIENPQHPYTQVLMWASSSIRDYDDPIEEPPLRDIDVPDPVNPPSGCSFHTRCPEARETCAERNPALESTAETKTACFWAQDDEEYAESDPLED